VQFFLNRARGPCLSTQYIEVLECQIYYVDTSLVDYTVPMTTVDYSTASCCWLRIALISVISTTSSALTLSEHIGHRPSSDDNNLSPPPPRQQIY